MKRKQFFNSLAVLCLGCHSFGGANNSSYVKLETEDTINTELIQNKVRQDYDIKREISLTRIKLYLKAVKAGNNEEIERLNEEFADHQFFLIGTNLSGFQLPGINLVNPQLQGANLEKTNLQGANLTGASLSFANVTNTQFQGANLTKAILTKVYGNNTQFTNAILKNIIIKNSSLMNANLVNTDLSFSSLSKVSFEASNLQGANLENGNLVKVNLNNTDLRNANFKDVTYKFTDDDTFCNVRLEGTNFIGLIFFKDDVFNQISEDSHKISDNIDELIELRACTSGPIYEIINSMLITRGIKFYPYG